MSSKRVKREQQVRKYLQDEVDPYIRPLLMELMKVRPPNVYEYLQYWVSSPAKEIYEKKQKEKQNEQEESVHYESIKEALVELGNDESEKKESAPVLEEVENQEDEEVKENEEVNEEIVTKTEEVVEEEETVKESMPEIEKQEDEVVSQKEVVETLNEEKEELKEDNEEKAQTKLSFALRQRISKIVVIRIFVPNLIGLGFADFVKGWTLSSFCYVVAYIGRL